MQKQRNTLLSRVSVLRVGLRRVDPPALAKRVGARLEPGAADSVFFCLTYWGRGIRVVHPDFVALDASSGRPLSASDQALLMYYFTTADGTPRQGKWVSFSELLDGRFYASAFQGYTGKKLAAVFGNDTSAFERAALLVGGQWEPFADRAFRFPFLPNVPLLIAFWAGDEEFSPSYRILFDAVVGHYLPTDACAIAGSMLTGRIVGKPEI